MSTIDHTATDKRDVYARVTAQIINAIEQGVGTWRMPWHTSGRYAFSPINAASKKPYRGINTVCLWAAAQAKGYERGEWATYQQWQDKGAQVRKGEKSTTVVFWKFAHESAESQDDGSEASAGRSRLLFTRGYSVFNAAQVDGYSPKRTRTYQYRNESRTRKGSSLRSTRTCRTGEIRPSTLPRRTISKCRRLGRSRKTWPTTPPLPMSIRTGPRRPRVVAVSLASASAITHMQRKS